MMNITLLFYLLQELNLSSNIVAWSNGIPNNETSRHHQGFWYFKPYPHTHIYCISIFDIHKTCMFSLCVWRSPCTHVYSWLSPHVWSKHDGDGSNKITCNMCKFTRQYNQCTVMFLMKQQRTCICTKMTSLLKTAALFQTVGNTR